jgi:hypothetical protein
MCVAIQQRLLLGANDIVAAKYSRLRPEVGVDIESVLALQPPSSRRVRGLAHEQERNRTLPKQSIIKILVIAREQQRLIRSPLALVKCVTLNSRLVTDLGNRSAWSMVQKIHFP